MSVTRSPAEYFIKFLLSRQEYTNETIEGILEEHQLEYIGVRYLLKVREGMGEFPDPFTPTPGKDAKAYSATKMWLRKQGIHDLWYATESVQEAYKILGQPRVREHVEQLLLSPMQPEAIAKKLSAHHKINISVKGLESFGHYFWNRALLSTEQWIDYMDDRPSQYKRITSMLASPDMADSVVPWLAGIAGPPPNINTGVVSRRVRDVAFMKVLEIERRPADIIHSKMMKNYMDVIKLAEDEMRHSDVALKEVIQAFEKFHLKKDDKKIPSIEDVAGPNYSRSGEGTGGEERNPLLEE